MKQVLGLRFLCIISSLTLALVVCNTASFGTDKTDVNKLYAEIAGDYAFEAPGGVSTITFSVKDGVLIATDRENKSFPLKPVEGNALAFEFIAEDGTRFEMTFTRDGSGKIAECVLAMMGMELKGTKRPEKSN